ncbi:hypothetical protein [Paraburkholderia largidicola]|uniref:Uncharacterized protein n=1 Tax=Paraburkholderia largidicola TaxID=3014751 RepID=A0A7I8BJU5_9BURK|nr:hypothetical protein [Paraburkholderia sp. PGU16]BCF88713.1 hypothetical protein PPGU16_17800 [Paraburkholderia sp. PGU16]
MSDTVHPNMFPRAADANVSVEEVAPAMQLPSAEAPARPSTAWANPITFTQATKPADAETNVDAGETKASKDVPKASKNETGGAKHGKTTRAEQAIASLREKGPLSSKDLCETMGIDAEVGISPYITQALKNGSIRRDRGRYFLPGQEASLPAAKESLSRESAPAAPTKKANAKPALSSEPEKAVNSVDTDVKPDPRVADFTLGVGDAVLTHWLDGSVSLQRGATVLELSREQTRLLTMFVDLCK